MRRIACHDCPNTVLVERYTEHHISVQWTQDAESACPRFATRTRRGQQGIAINTCSSLRSAIDEQVREGSIRITRRVEPTVKSISSQDIS